LPFTEFFQVFSVTREPETPTGGNLKILKNGEIKSMILKARQAQGFRLMPDAEKTRKNSVHAEVSYRTNHPATVVS